MIHQIFERLGLSPDADEQAVKRAYARLLKEHRPETDPAGFQRLHDAYQQALQWCRERATAPAHGAVDVPPVAATPQRLTPIPSSPSTPIDTAARAPAEPPAVMPEDILRELWLLAVQGDPAALRRWLEGHPGLWSLQLKQQLGATLLQELTRQPRPMPALCFDALLAYFELDQIARGADGLLQKQLREACSLRYSPIARYLAEQAVNRELDPRFEPERFLARMHELCTAGDPAHLWAWLNLQTMLWPVRERQQASQAALHWLRAESRPMPRACYEQLADFFDWPDQALGADAQATQAMVAERHLAWLMEPARVNLLARAVENPQERYADVPRTRRLRDLLARPFGWPGTLLLALSLSWPRELGDFIFRLRAAVGLHGRHVRLLGRYFDQRSLHFWSEAGAPGQLTRPKLIVWGVRLLALLALETLVCLLVAWLLAPGASAQRYPAIAVLVSLGVPLYLAIFNFLLFWQTLPGPHSRLATTLQQGFIPLVSMLAFGAGDRLWSPHYVSTGVALTMLALAYLRYLRQEHANRYFANLALASAIMMFAFGWIGATEPRPGWAVSFALLFWTLSLPRSTAATEARR